MKSCAKLKTIPTPHLAQDFGWGVMRTYTKT